VSIVVIVERIKGTDAPFYRPPLLQQESDGVHPGILALMKQCWDEEPSERPSFNDVNKTLMIVNDGKLAYCLLAFCCRFGGELLYVSAYRTFLALENAQNCVLNAHIEGVTKAQTFICEIAYLRTTHYSSPAIVEILGLKVSISIRPLPMLASHIMHI